MNPDPPLDYMLDQPGPPAGREELVAIVARSGRRRARTMAAGMAATLVIGGAVGWAVRPGRTTAGTPIAAGQPATSTTVAASSGLILGGSVATAVAGPITSHGFTFTKKFVRTTGDAVTIRAYQEGTANPAVRSVCGFVPGLTAEVSTADVAGSTGGGFSAAAPAPFQSVSANAIGLMEGAPVGVVTVRTDAAVAQVRVTFADGKTDQMAPVDGWSVLAQKTSVAPAGQATFPTGTVQALDASGKVIGTSALTEPMPPKMLPVRPPFPVPAATGPAPSSTPVTPPVKPVPTAIPGKGSTSSGAHCVASVAPVMIPPPGVKGVPVPPPTTAMQTVCGC